MLKVIALLLTLSLVSGAAYAQDANRRDGNWWRATAPAARTTYMVGVFDGVILGCNFAHWSYEANSAQSQSISDAVSSCDSHKARFLANVKSGQLVDGLNAFYDDFRNRSIVIDFAVWLVLNQIAGTSNVNTMIENFRRNATR